MPLPSGLPSFLSGFRLPPGDQLQALVDWISSFTGSAGSSQGGPLTAKAGGGQSGATLITAAITEVGTVASGNDSVQLPLAQAGMQLVVINNGANSMQVFGNSAGTDTINGTAGSTGVAHANGKTAVYYAPRVGVWFRDLSA